MKTTLELPDSVLHEAKMRAAQEGTTLRAIVCRALVAELAHPQPDEGKGWRKHLGGLRQLRDESVKVSAAIDEAFGRIDEDAWA
jgi:hypothetical protein